MTNFFIQKAHIKKGALHRELGIKQGHHIPLGKLQRIHDAKEGSHITSGGKKIKVTKLLKRRVQFAINIRRIKE